jgi:short-subunit dehydrogenase
MNVIITGASRGIGFAIARQFAAAGHTLFLCSRRAKALYDAVGQIQEQYPAVTVKAKPADMTDKNAVAEFAAWCLVGGIPDVVINNAGHFLPGSIYNEEEGLLEQMIQSNLYSAYQLTRALLPQMMARKHGHIFNICSIASLNAYPNGGSYSISKFALLGFSKNLREELKPHGIKVTAVCPGATMTDSWAGSNIDPKRIMEAEDVAKIIFTASQLSPMADVEDIIMRPQLGDL